MNGEIHIVCEKCGEAVIGLRDLARLVKTTMECEANKGAHTPPAHFGERRVMPTSPRPDPD